MSGFFTGKEALGAVGKKTGKWNWALVGADENELPLAGGGTGGIGEMQECLKAEGGVLFGLLRTNFPNDLAKFVFVLASSSNVHGAKRNVIGGGQAAGKRPIFEKEMRKYAPFTLTVEIHDPDDFTVEEVIGRLAKTSTADSSRITVPAYLEYLNNQWVKTQAGWVQESARDREEEGMMATELADFCPEVPAEEELECEAEPVPDALPPQEQTIELAMPDGDAPEAAEEEAKPEEAQAAAEAGAKEEVKAEETQEKVDPKPAEPEAVAVPEQKTEAKSEEKPAAPAAAAGPTIDSPFSKGQTVFVFSAAAKRWIGDGQIVEVLATPGTHQGFQLPAGAIKVQYSEGKRAKWIPPDEALKLIKVAPQAPPVLVGTLLKETHNFITEWHQRHFQISRGLMKWWMTQEEFTKDAKPNTTLTLKGLELQCHETTFRIRTGSSKGVIYAFDAGTAQNCKKWLDGIKAHAKYCDEVDQVFRK